MISNNKKTKPERSSDTENVNEFLRILGDDHAATGKNTPLREDAFVQDKESRIKKIEWHFREIMDALGLDLSDDSLKNTPQRVANMYVNEIFHGLDPKNKPEITLFDNKFEYDQMLVEKNITLQSYCEHHFVPILGKAHVAYFSNKHVIGLSKINRIVDHFARRPQVQERLTEQIAEELMRVLKTEDVAVLLEAEHMCVVMRGIKDQDSSTTTGSFHGKFLDKDIKNEFLAHIYRHSK
ncbi:MAG: GTP cyclohydrolase I FolE [Bacteroidales bacterium]